MQVGSLFLEEPFRLLAFFPLSSFLHLHSITPKYHPSGRCETTLLPYRQ